MVDQDDEFDGVPGRRSATARTLAAGDRSTDSPPESDFFAVADVEYAASVASPSDGDLWPSAWADDDGLYAACGDGLGFSDADWADIVVNRIDGHPLSGLSGERLAAGRDVSPVWTDPERFNSKPTGMVAVDGNGDGRDELYLAVQDLRYGASPDTFNVAPAAGIVRSDDYGRTWQRPGAPMFTDQFTTVMFLDFGRSNSGATVLRDLPTSDGRDPAGFVYAYGLDHNWRTSYSGAVPDPVDLYLARVPVTSIQDRSTWEFFAGTAADGAPTWSTGLAGRCPVLTDTRRVGERVPLPGAPAPLAGTRIAQGGVVHNAPLGRYLYTSWTEFTFEFYEAPTPWGPWRPFLHREFGPFPWTGPRSAEGKHGGYATTIPSKFISADGRDAWLQSNWFVGASTYAGSSYHFSLRAVRLDPAPPAGTAPAEAVPGQNLAQVPGARAIASSCRSGRVEVLTDGSGQAADDSWDGTRREADHWGCTWPTPVRLSCVRLTSGPHDYGSGWFARPPRVEVRLDGRWCDVAGVATDPAYPCDYTATGTKTYTFTFAPVVTTGVRLVGPAGGWGGYTSVAELEVYADVPSAPVDARVTGGSA